MPKLRIGTIPPTRLADARKVRDNLKQILGPDAKVVVSITNGGFSVEVKDADQPSLPKIFDGIPVKLTKS